MKESQQGKRKYKLLAESWVRQIAFFLAKVFVNFRRLDQAPSRKLKQICEALVLKLCFCLSYYYFTATVFVYSAGSFDKLK
jgi:hypothetical protein